MDEKPGEFVAEVKFDHEGMRDAFYMWWEDEGHGEFLHALPSIMDNHGD